MLALPAGVAQLVAQAICNRQVVGSSPTAGSNKCAGRTAAISVTAPCPSASAQQPAQQRGRTGQPRVPDDRCLLGSHICDDSKHG
jgi:hypothetical protein